MQRIRTPLLLHPVPWSLAFVVAVARYPFECQPTADDRAATRYDGQSKMTQKSSNRGGNLVPIPAPMNNKSSYRQKSAFSLAVAALKGDTSRDLHQRQATNWDPPAPSSGALDPSPPRVRRRRCRRRAILLVMTCDPFGPPCSFIRSPGLSLASVVAVERRQSADKLTLRVGASESQKQRYALALIVSVTYEVLRLTVDTQNYPRQTNRLWDSRQSASSVAVEGFWTSRYDMRTI